MYQIEWRARHASQGPRTSGFAGAAAQDGRFGAHDARRLLVTTQPGLRSSAALLPIFAHALTTLFSTTRVSALDSEQDGDD
jgi:hypothetical protein